MLQKIGVILCCVGVGCTGALWLLFGPVSLKNEPGVFVVPEKKEGFDTAGKLAEGNFIRNSGPFQILLDIVAPGRDIASGGYRLNKNMNSWQVVNIITENPDLLWVTTTGCVRKEQIGEMIGRKLGWDEVKLKQWNNSFKDTNKEYTEGVYYPDTYLIPRDETGGQVAQRFVDRFNEKFAPLAPKFAGKNIKWTTGLKIASLIEREASGPQDMKLISGIIWNRLGKGILLQIDATMQYTRGTPSASPGQGGDWWGPIDLAEKTKDSPYNTYIYKGLPPTPICSPGVPSLEAALNPDVTACIFYLHDRAGQIHCSKTYQEHKRNIDLYLN